MNEIEHLAAMSADGDRSAFEALYQRTCQSVYFTCLSFLKNEQDAADATQDVYLTALEELPALNDKSKFIPWLNRIAVNKCKNMLTKKKPVLMDYEDMDYLQTEENENFLPEEYVTNQAKRKIVMDIMEKSLSDTLYQTVIMYYFNGISVTEIAEIMGCPVGTVTYRLSVARAKIKEGVLRYENRNDDKLYAFAGVPFLTSLLVAEMQGLAVPDMLPNIMNMVSKGAAVAAQAAKGGANMMLRTLKSKIIAGIIAAGIVGGGIAAAVVISNNDDKDNGGSGIVAEIDANSGTEEATSENVQMNTESTGETTEEAAGGIGNTGSRWLLQQDFSAGQLGSMPEDFTLFYEQIAAPVSLEDIKQNFDAIVYAISNEGIGTEQISGSAEEILSSDSHFYFGSSWMDRTGHIFLLEKGTDNTVTYMNVYNFSEQEMSIAECVNNGWWGFYYEGESGIYSLLGYNEEDIQTDEKAPGKGVMELLIQELGSPNYLNIWGETPEDFLARADEENTLSSYELGWVFDDYVLNLYCYDSWFYGENTFEIASVLYVPREVWEMTEDKNATGYKEENQIYQIFQ